MTKPTWEIHTGDCLEFLRSLPDGSVKMIWTDPPYGHSNADRDFLSNIHNILRDELPTIQVPIVNDDADSMRKIVDGMLVEAARVLEKDCCCCCCCCCCGGGGPSPTFAWLAQRMDEKGMRFFHSVIWDKRVHGVGWRYRRQYEMVMVAHRKGGRCSWPNDENKQPNIISLAKRANGAGNDHPNEKPVGLVKRFIELHTSPGDLVVDPFCGSGTTGVACIQTGRNFIGCEIDPGYADVARRRCREAEESFGLLDYATNKETQGELL